LRKPTIILLFMLAAVRAAAADTREIPQLVTQGFASYRALGVSAGLKTWLRNSPLEGSEEAAEAAQVLAAAERAYGRFENFEVLQLSRFGSRTWLVFAAVEYERGSLFSRFVAYRIRNDWVINALRFDPAPEAVLPDTLLGN
jgi:hypothetical protein